MSTPHISAFFLSFIHSCFVSLLLISLLLVMDTENEVLFWLWCLMDIEKTKKRVMVLAICTKYRFRKKKIFLGKTNERRKYFGLCGGIGGRSVHSPKRNQTKSLCVCATCVCIFETTSSSSSSFIIHTADSPTRTHTDRRLVALTQLSAINCVPLYAQQQWTRRRYSHTRQLSHFFFLLRHTRTHTHTSLLLGAHMSCSAYYYS